MKRDFLLIRAAYASIFVAFTIIISKMIGWYITDSSAMFASLTDSLLDITASSINFFAIKYALQPPDNEHRFGHGKAEDLAVFAQSTFFGLSGIFIIIISMKRLIYPKIIEKGDLGIAIMIFSILITICLVLYQTYVIHKTNTSIVKADLLHYSIDLLSNFAVIISLFLSVRFNSRIIDPIFALLIALYMLYGAWLLLKRAFYNLMDRELEQKEKEKIHKIVMSQSKVKGYHDLKTRNAGSQAFIQLHLDLDSEISLRVSHQIAEEVELEILKEFPEAEIIIHQDPEDVKEKKQFKEL